MCLLLGTQLGSNNSTDFLAPVATGLGFAIIAGILLSAAY